LCSLHGCSRPYRQPPGAPFTCGAPLDERTNEIFAVANEQPDAFRVSSRYVIATVCRAIVAPG
jgi:hypothetical protein